MNYKLLNHQIKVKPRNTTWLFYLLIPIVLGGYYFFRRNFKFEGVASEIITTALLFIFIFGGFYLLAFVYPRWKFKKNIIGTLTIGPQGWKTEEIAIRHDDIKSLGIQHDWIKRTTFSFNDTEHAWHISIRINETKLSFFIETDEQIEHLRKLLVNYYKEGLHVEEVFRNSKVKSLLLFVCVNDEAIENVKKHYFDTDTTSD